MQSHQPIPQQQGQSRPRSVPAVATSPVSSKPLTARGIITTQRNIVTSTNSPQLKTNTPLTGRSRSWVTEQFDCSSITQQPFFYLVSYSAVNTVNNTPILLTSQKMQIQLQKQALIQQQDQQCLKLSNQLSPSSLKTSTATMVVTPQSSMSPPLAVQSPLNTSQISLENLTSNDGTLHGANSNPLINAVTIALQKKNRRRSTASDLNK